MSETISSDGHDSMTILSTGTAPGLTGCTTVLRT